MSYSIIPWEPQNIPEEIQSEFNRRRANRSFKYVQADTGEWENENGKWNTYRGPMSPWVRLCSNGRGSENNPGGVKEGFIFFGGKDFYSGYGFNGKSGDPSIIGYVPDNTNRVHTIDNDIKTSNYPVHVPPPEIEKVQLVILNKLVRQATIDWTCFSRAQLEYMTPYFLVPGITCIMEWGWNHYNPKSLVDLNNISLLGDLYNNPYPLYTDHVILSRGNYDVIFGLIDHFEWSIDGNKFKCQTRITSKDSIYPGLIIDSTMIDSKKENEKPLDNIANFINNTLIQFKAVETKDPESIDKLKEFVGYIKQKHSNWQEYVYGVFYGRDTKVTNKFQDGADTISDFDYKPQSSEELWINFGLVIEALNFHVSLNGMKFKEAFRIDIDDCIINGHPNMISSNGRVCLIPNAKAPKYFHGIYGPTETKSQNYSKEDWDKLKVCTEPIVSAMTKEAAKISGISGQLADYKVYRICEQSGGTYRDNLDEIINRLRYEKSSGSSFEFPFKTDRDSYPALYAGYLKNIYVNLKFLKEILGSTEQVETYSVLIEKILKGINSACGNFWDFRVVSATGKKDLAKIDLATMKIIDAKFMATTNKGKLYTFDYMESDSLLLGMSFKPTISQAQAIQVIYSPMNNPDKNTTLTNGRNELLDYKFKDRLMLNDDKKNKLPEVKRNIDNFKETMRTLQQILPRYEQYQMTTMNKGNRVVRRLAMPAPDVLSLLLDDEDYENNPKYTGIMPGVQATFTLQGIGGLRTFMMFLVRNLPEPYSHKNVIFQIINVQESIESGKWITTIVAGLIPLRNYIKRRFGIT